MAEQDSDERLKQQSDWERAHLGESYTQAFKIRQVMYRIQDVDLPFKRGIRVEQFLMFLGGLVVMFILTNLLIYPLMNLIGLTMPITFHMVLWLALPIFLSVRIGKPMPHHKTVSGMAMSFLRYNLDDRWHCRGLPLKKAPSTGLEGNYLRTWTVDPAYQGIEAAGDIPATEFALYTNLDLPDDKVILPGQEVQKKRILEDEDAFLDRLTAVSTLSTTDDFEYEEEVDVAPVFKGRRGSSVSH